MTPLRTLAAICCAAAALVSLPTAATASRSDWFTGYEINYLDTYEQAYKADLNPGRNIVDDGLANGEPASRAQVIESTDRMEAWLNPPEPAPVAETTSTETTYSGGVGGSTVMCESGGDYSANTGNGYYGGYQFDSGTWDAYGDPQYGEASDAPPGVQDQAAANVPYDAWPNC